MSRTTRRDFLSKAGSAAVAGAAIRPVRAQDSPNERINVAVIGFHSRGMAHIRGYAQLPNVRVAALCDVDERLFPPAVAEVERLSGHRPITEHDMRRLLERKDIDAVSIATPDYWHALQTIWACQAGKDVYVEKPISFTVVEGRRMVEAARKYKRIVQAGTNLRSEQRIRAAMRALNEGKLGKVYRASCDFSKPRASIGRQKEAPVPQGVHWDLFLGPSPYRPFTLNRFHYGWHYFWETGPSEVGNIGYAPPRSGGTTFYTSEGYMTSADGWKAFRGAITPRNRPHSAGVDETNMNASFPEASYTPGSGILASDN